MRIGSRIRELRRSRNMTIAQLAEKAGISTSLVSQVERDRISPSLTTLAAVASVLNVPLANLFRENGTASVCRAETPSVSAVGALHPVAGRPGLRLGVTSLAPGQSRTLGPEDGGAVGIVLQGRVDLDCGAGRECLSAKDAFILRHDGHGYLHNQGAVLAEIYWVLESAAS